MFKKVFFLVFLTFLKVSYELDCTRLYGPTCEGHNTNYNLKSRQFRTDSNWVEVEIDDGWQIIDGQT